MREQTMELDYIVVGGGSAGCVTAARLVAEFGAKVLLLESGSRDRHPLIHMPSGFVKMLLSPDPFMVGHESLPQPALGGRTVNVLQANVLGGGSSVNAMTYTRGTRDDYDRWDKAIGDLGWGWADILPHFVRQEGNQRLGAPLHGVHGPLKVSDAHHPPTDISRAFLLTLQEMGLPFTPDVNGGDERGATFIQSTTFRGRRCSSAKAFIEPLERDKRLTIKFNSPALRIIIERGRAIGVEYADAGGGRGTASARCEIILTAGAFISPKLLMLSGIGPAPELRKHGIDVVVDLAGVGQNMQDHNDASLIVETKGNYGYSGEDRGLRLLTNGLQYLLFNSGPVTSTGSEVTAFLNPLSLGSDPTIQLYCVPKILQMPGGSMCPPGATLMANLIAPKSRGSMRLRSADPRDLPIVDPGWLTCREDITMLVAGVRFLLKLTRTSPFAEKVLRVVSPAPEGQTDEQLEQFIRQVTGTNWHPVGSCRMGADDDPTAVLDPELRVRGVERLRVFDGSMMPGIIRANTNAPIMAIADRGVSLMMGTSSLRKPRTRSLD